MNSALAIHDALLGAAIREHGGVARRGGDYLGGTVNRCALRREAAHGGQILLSRSTAEVVRDGLAGASMADGGGEVTLRDLGVHQLRDFLRSERIFQLEAAET